MRRIVLALGIIFCIAAGILSVPSLLLAGAGLFLILWGVL